MKWTENQKIVAVLAVLIVISLVVFAQATFLTSETELAWHGTSSYWVVIDEDIPEENWRIWVPQTAYAGAPLYSSHTLEWYVNKDGNIVSAESQGWDMHGTKAVIFSQTLATNTHNCYIMIYKGGLKNPQTRENIQWRIIDMGSVQSSSYFNVRFTNPVTGAEATSGDLKLGEDIIVNLPSGSRLDISIVWNF